MLLMRGGSEVAYSWWIVKPFICGGFLCSSLNIWLNGMGWWSFFLKNKNRVIYLFLSLNPTRHACVIEARQGVWQVLLMSLCLTAMQSPTSRVGKRRIPSRTDVWCNSFNFSQLNFRLCSQTAIYRWNQFSISFKIVFKVYVWYYGDKSKPAS